MLKRWIGGAEHPGWRRGTWGALGCGCLLAAVLVVGCQQAAPPPTFPKLDQQAREKLRDRIDRVLETCRTRHMSVADQGAWQVLHGTLVFGRDLMIYDGERKLVPAIDYLLGGGVMTGWNLRPADHGVQAILESGSRSGQGHKDQWIGYMALSPCQFPLDHKVRVGTQEFVLNDLVTQAEWECVDGMEGSWTLMTMSAYRSPQYTWKSRDGQEWSVERLLKMEIGQNIAQSACGGTHRLTGITAVVNQYVNQNGGKPLEGVWAEAEDKIQEFSRLAKAYQQPNGALSTSYFIRPAFSQDLQTQIGTTGHALEFLTYSLTKEELDEPWVAACVDFLCDRFEKAEKIDLEAGAFYHAAAGLRLYRIRQYGLPEPATTGGEPATTSVSRRPE